MRAKLELSDVTKSFTMHLRGGLKMPVVDSVSFSVEPGECVALAGPSGSGKSSILKMVYGNYAVDRGRILVAHDGAFSDVAVADPRTILDLRRTTIGYVTQFLRVVPRVSTRDVVAEPLLRSGAPLDEARVLAEALLARLNIPHRLWDLPPATFSGGEQQRVNIARGLVGRYSLLLLDEPTASLDAENSTIVAHIITELKAAGVAILGIFHDTRVRDHVADRVLGVTAFSSYAMA